MLQVLDWEKHFETCKTKTYKNKSSFMMPLKSGLGLQRLLAMKNGPALYGCWCALVAALSRQDPPRRGLLSSNGLPSGDCWDTDDVALVTFMPHDLVEQMISAVTSKKIGWIGTYVQSPDSLPTGDQQGTIVPRQSHLDLYSYLDSYSYSYSNPKVCAEILSSIQSAFPKTKSCNMIASSLVMDNLDKLLGEAPAMQDLNNWSEYLDKIKASDFLSKQASIPITLLWIVTPKNCMEVMAGKYDNTETAKRRAGNAILI